MKKVMWMICAASMLTLSGCATNNPRDPLEPYNRAVFKFNDTVDRAALQPVARAYRHLPSFVQTGVGNFFGNLADLPTGVNNLLQGKVADGMSDLMRFAFNSTFGFAGFLDIASEAGLTKHSEDFGQTLGKWGVPSGPYVILPLLGSSTLRDTSALPVDIRTDPWRGVEPESSRYWGVGVRVVDQRSVLLDASTLLEEAALDRYTFIRDAYLQRRQSKVNDGESPRTSYEDEPYEPTAGFDDPAQQATQSAASQSKNDTSGSGGAAAAEPRQTVIVKEESNRSEITEANAAAPAELKQ
jgi:phospholipid-binding lipoprotein MlaA